MDDLIAAMASLTGSPADPEVLGGDRGDVVVVRVGDVVAKALPADTDIEALRQRLDIAAAHPELMLPPLMPLQFVDDRPVTVWPYGTPVSQADPDAAPWEESAALLAKLHVLPAQGPVAGAPERIVRAIKALPPELPHADVVLRAFEVLPPLGMSAKALIHGDWHLGQLVHRGAWRLIDVDDLGVGDPVWDLARPAALFAAGVLPADLWARFLNAYREAGGVALPTSEWEALNIPAQAYVVQMAARALMSGLQAVEPLVEACRRIVATYESSDRG
ncbi:phosphotransferase family protein [Lentzea sp. CC55]|uniref:phosphotransferase family protein n=1 Tax=Lentzea sp. CC55 TaxID=2884909 RepID=UPI0027DED72A|nr:phosphotransferase [Lentzea sp. CC55]MCG8921199.1 aminoglycoside phosphotransferase family protein [Lentzea sp. CC55]